MNTKNIKNQSYSEVKNWVKVLFIFCSIIDKSNTIEYLVAGKLAINILAFQIVNLDLYIVHRFSHDNRKN